MKRLPFGLLFVLTALSTSAADGLLSCPVTLAWDASPDVNVTGYALYYGLENSAVTNHLDVGPAQSVTLTNLYAASNYFFYVVAYNVLGMESVPSGTLNYSPLALTRLRISRLVDGSMSLKFRSAAGSQCRIEYSTPQFTQWQTLAATNADAGGNVAVNDLSAALTTSRFYRAARP